MLGRGLEPAQCSCSEQYPAAFDQTGRGSGGARGGVFHGLGERGGGGGVFHGLDGGIKGGGGGGVHRLSQRACAALSAARRKAGTPLSCERRRNSANEARRPLQGRCNSHRAVGSCKAVTRPLICSYKAVQRQLQGSYKAVRHRHIHGGDRLSGPSLAIQPSLTRVARAPHRGGGGCHPAAPCRPSPSPRPASPPACRQRLRHTNIPHGPDQRLPAPAARDDPETHATDAATV